MTDDVRSRIGEQVRLLRKRQRRTLEDLAEQAGYTKSLLSKIENGRILPSVGALVRIATALGTSVSALIEHTDNPRAIYTPRCTVDEMMTETRGGLQIYPFATGHLDNRMQPVLYRVRRGKVALGVDSHEGHEFIYVLKGTLRFRVANIDCNMEEGDSIYFDSLEKHEGKPVSEVVEYLDIFISNG